MDPVEQAFVTETLIYLAAVCLVFVLGFAVGRASARPARRNAMKEASARAWKLSRIINRHQMH